MARSPRLHPAWIVLAALAICMMARAGLRAAFGVYVKPMEADVGWTRTALSGVAAVSLLLLGAVGPLVGRVADRWGPRRIIIASIGSSPPAPWPRRRSTRSGRPTSPSAS